MAKFPFLSGSQLACLLHEDMRLLSCSVSLRGRAIATATTIKRKQREEEIQEYMCRASKTTKVDWGGGKVWGEQRR